MWAHYLQHQLKQTSGLLSCHYGAPPPPFPRDSTSILCGCYEALENIISIYHQPGCVWRVLLIAADERIRIPVDIRSAFDCVRGIIQEPAVSVMWQVMGLDCEH